MLTQNLGAVKIVEVGPRDGLQNEASFVATEDKIAYIELLAKAGLKNIEATSFVSPKAVAQMADSTEVYRGLSNVLKNTTSFPCLVPNEKGMEAALAAGIKEIAIFTATSDEFNQKNINTDVEGSFKRLQIVVDMAKQNNVKIRGYVSTAFGCPYAGEIGVQKLIEVTKRLLVLGAQEVSIGDTIGIATPGQVESYLTTLLKEVPADKLAMHFHDTRAMAILNIFISYRMGIRTFDASSGGLGGCPYAKGASGNVATEEVVRLFNSMGVETGVDLAKLVKASEFILKKLGKESSSKFVNAYQKTGK